MSYQRGARPIPSQPIYKHYNNYHKKTVDLHTYDTTWRYWLEETDPSKVLLGLDQFKYADFTNGTSQTFDHFILKYGANRKLVVLPGEFMYHHCAGRHFKFVDTVAAKSALVISVPFSDTGSLHPEFDTLLQKCNRLDVPVCLDLAYWGIARDIHLDLTQYPCVKEVTASLSKPFFTLENHRVGVRFTRDYVDDGISMINEVSMQNTHSMGLGVYYMEKFGSDFMWNLYEKKYEQACKKLKLQPTNTVIFGLGGEEYKEFNRGIPGNNRVCISPTLADL